MAVVVVLVDVDEDVDADVVVCNVSKSHRAAEQKLVHKKESRKLTNWLFTKGLDINFFSTSQNFRLWICLGAREIRSWSFASSKWLPNRPIFDTSRIITGCRSLGI